MFVSVSVLLIVGTTTVPDLILPVPFGFIFMSMFVSHPVASSIGQFVVVVELIVNSFTAQAVSVFGNFKSSFQELSAKYLGLPEK